MRSMRSTEHPRASWSWYRFLMLYLWDRSSAECRWAETRHRRIKRLYGLLPD